MLQRTTSPQKLRFCSTPKNCDFYPHYRFDETLELTMPSNLDCSSSFLHLSVKDRGVMGEGVFLGEAFLPLGAVDRTHEEELRLRVRI